MAVTIHRGKNCAFNGAGAAVVTRKNGASYGRRQTVFFADPPKLVAGAAAVGKREGDGPIGKFFDVVIEDPKMGEKNFENAEIAMLDACIRKAVDKAGLVLGDIDMLYSGDLLNQITTSSYVARGLNVPYTGLYSACSTMTQSMAIAAAMISAGYYTNAVCSAASHFATSERQYRFPLEYGAQRPPFAQWTVTGAGASVISSQGYGPKITAAIFGKVVDYGMNDLSNMGAAMAPAAADTLEKLFVDTETAEDDYDLILTGDLGKLGSDILRDLMRERGRELGQRYVDCGALIFDGGQKCYQGGSGAGCSAAVFNSYILQKIGAGEYGRVIFLATGALMSTQSCYQGETIPAISHGVIIENEKRVN
jgi:stage V sporulation protein AD